MRAVKYPNVSLLIQGPLYQGKLDALDFLPYYSILFNEIIISTYTEHINDLENGVFRKFCEHHKLKLVEQTINIGNLRNDNRVGYQTYTTLGGLESVTNPYVVKHRIDERYFCLDKVVDKFLLDDNKWVCGSMLFGPKVYRKFHAGDHLIVCKTDKLKATFKLTMDNLKQGLMEGNFDELNCPPGVGAPEITYTKNFLRINGEQPDNNRHDELIRKYFDIVNNKELYPFVVRENGSNSLFTTIQDLGPNRNQYDSIDAILNNPYLPGY